jgi:3-methyladenine DNA glycosylase AlkD
MPRTAGQPAAEAQPSVEEILEMLRRMGNPANFEGMTRFGINCENRFGVSIPKLRALACKLGRDHDRARRLWATGNDDARMLAALSADPEIATSRQCDAWVRDIRSWDVCDITCANMFARTPMAWQKAVQWSARREEFVKRASFAVMASLAVHDKTAPDAEFIGLLPIIEREAGDERNYVKKAVNWALRQIGKRNGRLNREAIRAGERIQNQGSRGARWIAADALRELRSEAVQGRLRAGKSRVQGGGARMGG